MVKQYKIDWEPYLAGSCLALREVLTNLGHACGVIPEVRMLQKHMPNVVLASDHDLAMRRVKALIESEPECPGGMPDEMWEAVKNDRDATTELCRTVVRETKKCILNRITAASLFPPERREL